MAPSYDPADALAMITPSLGNATLDSTAKGLIADEAQRVLWNFAPWKWERKNASDITIVHDTQDYTTIPSDFMGLLAVQIVRTDVTPNKPTDLKIVDYINADKTEKKDPNSIDRITYLQELNSAAGGFRIPNPSIVSPVTAVIRITYRKTPATKYTSANLTTDFVELPDQYFYLYKEWLLYEAYRYLGDPRAGTATFTKSGWVYSGQLAVANSLSLQALQTEDYSDTTDIFPETSLGVKDGWSFQRFP